METYGLERRQLAMCSSLMSLMSSKHPAALTRQPRSFETVLSSPVVAPSTTVLECARRADGGAAVILASSQFMERRGMEVKDSIAVISGGEGFGGLTILVF